MGWENRKGGQYYYGKLRAGKTVVSVYMGARDAEAMERKQELAREGRRKDGEERHEIAAINVALDEYYGMVRAITEASLRASGYHLHKGEWRKRRMAKRQSNPVAPLDAAGAPHAGVPAEAGAQPQVGGQQVAPAEQTGLAVREGSTLARAILKLTLDVFKDAPPLRALVEREADELQAGLGYATAGPLERVWIEQVVIATTQLKVFQLKQAALMAQPEHASQARFFDAQVDGAQRRLQRACGMLEQMRWWARRTPEVLQVNIGAQQVNVVEGHRLTD